MLRVALRAANADKGQEMVNTVHYDLDDAGPAEDNSPQSLADRIRDDCVVPFRALFSNQWQIDPVVVTEEIDPQAPDAPREQWTSGVSSPGTKGVAGDLLPTACFVMFTWQTGLVGRSFRGRMLVGGSALEADQADGIWTGAGFAALAEVFVNSFPLEPDIAPPASVATAKLCVYSRTRRARDQDPYAPAIIGHARSNQVRWLRSRQPGR